MISFEAIPDIVPAELLVGPDDLCGWEPMAIDIDPSRMSRIKAGLLVPKEMALQLVFGSHRHGFDPKDSLNMKGVLASGRQMSNRSNNAPGTHETGYLFSIALWHERDAVVDYVNSYRSYSHAFDAHDREFYSETASGRLTGQLSERLEEYVSYVECGCRSKQEAFDMCGRADAERTLAMGIEGLRAIYQAEASEAIRNIDPATVIDDCAAIIERDNMRLARFAKARE